MIFALLATLGCTDTQLQDSNDSQGAEPLGRVQSVAWMSQVLQDPDYQIVDVRSPEDFEAGHVPGALNVYWEDLRAELGGISGMRVDADTAQSVMQAAGVAQDRVVVAYGGRGGRDAGRFAWTMDYYGHPETLVVDGGWLQFELQGLTLEPGPSGAQAGDWSAGAAVDAVLAESEWLSLNLDSVVVVDLRTQEEYDEGHIPGAVLIPWTENIHQEGAQEGLLLDRQELEALYAQVPLDARVVVTCRSGARAGMGYLVLPHLGYEGVLLHDGSWKEWEAGGFEVQ